MARLTNHCYIPLGKSIAEVLKETSENAIQHSGYDFDERTGLYYHKSSGYFYDPDRKLFFEPKTRIYLKYNCETGQYDRQPAEACGRRFKEFEALLSSILPDAIEIGNKEPSDFKNVSPSHEQQLKHHSSRHRSCHSKKRRRHCASSPESDCSPASRSNMHVRRKRRSSPFDSDRSPESSRSPHHFTREKHSSEKNVMDCSSVTDEHIPDQITSVAAAPMIYPLGLRLVVLASKFTTLGTIFTLSSEDSSRGLGCVGRNPTFCSSVNFPDDPDVATIHCELVYEPDTDRFLVLDRDCSSGTFLNGQALKKQIPVQIVHGDILRIGSSRLLVHIHRGSDVCEQCDPESANFAVQPLRSEVELELTETTGSVRLSTQTTLDAQRRATLDQLKEKYGIRLLNSESCLDNSTTYTDRAARRRAIEKNLKSAGLLDTFLAVPKPTPSRPRRRSMSPTRNVPSPPPVPAPLNQENRGAQLLSKMGWNPGQGLGKHSSGIVEPINPISRLNSRAGLGASDSRSEFRHQTYSQGRSY